MKQIAALIGGMSLVLSLAPAAPALAADPAMIGLHIVKIRVKDYQKTIDFYSALGMKLGTKYNAGEWELTWPDPANGAKIVMMHSDTPTADATPNVTMFLIQVADAAAVGAKLKSMGYPGVPDPKISARAVTVNLVDPDGNKIEMVSPPPAKP